MGPPRHAPPPRVWKGFEGRRGVGLSFRFLGLSPLFSFLRSEAEPPTLDGEGGPLQFGNRRVGWSLGGWVGKFGENGGTMEGNETRIIRPGVSTARRPVPRGSPLSEARAFKFSFFPFLGFASTHHPGEPRLGPITKGEGGGGPARGELGGSARWTARSGLSARFSPRVGAGRRRARGRSWGRASVGASKEWVKFQVSVLRV